MTKTTAQIRSLYASGAYTGAGQDQRLADFDEWLAAHDREVRGESTSEYVKGYVDSDGTQGYVIERGTAGYRYVWKEVGEPDDEGEWFDAPSAAIVAAWDDWNTNGQGYHWSDWSKKLAHDAGFKENA